MDSSGKTKEGDMCERSKIEGCQHRLSMVYPTVKSCQEVVKGTLAGNSRYQTNQTYFSNIQTLHENLSVVQKNTKGQYWVMHGGFSLFM